MRLLILSDVHADGAALDAVLADADGDFDALVLLGDLIGYGDDPVRTVDRLRALGPVARVRGNHEAMLDDLRAGRVPNAARSVLDRLAAHGDALDDDALAWALDAPERARYAADLGPALDLVHGGPRPDRPFEVLLGVPAARRALPHLHEAVLLFGHSHVPGGFVEVDGRVRPLTARGRETILELRRGDRWLLNPGSVGRPRDGGPAGCSALLDLAAGTVRFRRIDAPA
jgi:predicted phosphodiesterase